MVQIYLLTIITIIIIIIIIFITVFSIFPSPILLLQDISCVIKEHSK